MRVPVTRELCPAGRRCGSAILPWRPDRILERLATKYKEDPRSAKNRNGVELRRPGGRLGAPCFATQTPSPSSPLATPKKPVGFTSRPSGWSSSAKTPSLWCSTRTASPSASSTSPPPAGLGGGGRSTSSGARSPVAPRCGQPPAKRAAATLGGRLRAWWSRGRTDRGGCQVFEHLEE